MRHRWMQSVNEVQVNVISDKWWWVQAVSYGKCSLWVIIVLSGVPSGGSQGHSSWWPLQVYTCNNTWDQTWSTIIKQMFCSFIISFTKLTRVFSNIKFRFQEFFRWVYVICHFKMNLFYFKETWKGKIIHSQFLLLLWVKIFKNIVMLFNEVYNNTSDIFVTFMIFW